MKWKEWWLSLFTPKPTKQDIDEMTLAIRKGFAQLERTNPLADEKFKYEMYFCAALSGLLARGGVVGIPEENYGIIAKAHAHAAFIMRAGKP